MRLSFHEAGLPLSKNSKLKENTMRNNIAKSTGIGLLALSVSASAASFSGEIMDSQCAAMGNHKKMIAEKNMPGEKECAIACVRMMGGKFVLYDSAKKAVYTLDDQTKPEQFAGQKVKVTGTLDKATNTIRVASIKAGS
jgi:hypothetical protein